MSLSRLSNNKIEIKNGKRLINPSHNLLLRYQS
jgi:hypothetical protein